MTINEMSNSELNQAVAVEVMGWHDKGGIWCSGKPGDFGNGTPFINDLDGELTNAWVMVGQHERDGLRLTDSLQSMMDVNDRMSLKRQALWSPTTRGDHAADVMQVIALANENKWFWKIAFNDGFWSVAIIPGDFSESRYYNARHPSFGRAICEAALEFTREEKDK